MQRLVLSFIDEQILMKIIMIVWFHDNYITCTSISAMYKKYSYHSEKKTMETRIIKKNIFNKNEVVGTSKL